MIYFKICDMFLVKTFLCCTFKTPNAFQKHLMRFSGKRGAFSFRFLKSRHIWIHYTFWFQYAQVWQYYIYQTETKLHFFWMDKLEQNSNPVWHSYDMGFLRQGIQTLSKNCSNDSKQRSFINEFTNTLTILLGTTIAQNNMQMTCTFINTTSVHMWLKIQENYHKSI